MTLALTGVTIKKNNPKKLLIAIGQNGDSKITMSDWRICKGFELFCRK